MFFAFLKEHKTPLLFLLSGGSAAAFQLLVYFVCTRIFGFPYLIASAISFVTALIVSFLLQKFVAFEENTVKAMPKQFLWFCILASFNLGMNSMLMYTFVGTVGIHDIFSQALTMIVIAVWSFFIYRHIIFKM